MLGASSDEIILVAVSFENASRHFIYVMVMCVWSYVPLLNLVSKISIALHFSLCFLIFPYWVVHAVLFLSFYFHLLLL